MLRPTFFTCNCSVSRHKWQQKDDKITLHHHLPPEKILTRTMNLNLFMLFHLFRHHKFPNDTSSLAGWSYLTTNRLPEIYRERNFVNGVFRRGEWPCSIYLTHAHPIIFYFEFSRLRYSVCIRLVPAACCFLNLKVHSSSLHSCAIFLLFFTIVNRED